MGKQVSTIRGVVRALDRREAIIEVEQGGCGRCHEEGGCGGQQLTQMFCAGSKIYRADNPDGVQVGEKVDVVIAAGAIRHGANVAYVLPLLGLMGGAVLGMQIAGDAGAMIGGTTVMFLSWFLTRQHVRAGSGNLENRPYIISRSHP